jgi:hypothetical protein
MRRHLVPAGLVLTAVLVSAAVATGGSSAGGEDASASRTIASKTTSDFRVVVTAEKLGSGDAPAATATLETYRRVGAGWRRTGSHELDGPYFWKTLTGQRAVCRLEIRTTGGATRFRPRTLVQLLQTPSVGCGPVSEIPLSG